MTTYNKQPISIADQISILKAGGTLEIKKVPLQFLGCIDTYLECILS